MNKKQMADHHFESWSETYEQSYLQKLIFDRVHRAVLETIPAGFNPRSILDIGCGTGRLLRRAHQIWPDAALNGIDPTAGMVEKAHELTPGATFYIDQAESLPLPDGSIDLVLSTVSFHHWQDQALGIRQASRVLRPGGYFILADMAVPYWIWKITHHGQHASGSKIKEMTVQSGLVIQSQKRSLSANFLITASKKPDSK